MSEPLTLGLPKRSATAAKPKPTCGTCGSEDALHAIERRPASAKAPAVIASLCCACWVAEGRPAADWHAGCRKAAGIPEPERWR